MAVSHRRLGNKGVLVSNLCLGTMNFGHKISKEDSFAILDRALELGINFVDTADAYGFEKGRGLTEEILGEWLAQDAGVGSRRESIVLATKVYAGMNREGRRPEPNRDNRCLSALKIIRHCEDGLRRLRTDRIDILQMHHVDRSCPWDEIWEAMETLKRQGKTLYVGSSNFAGWDIATACQEASRRGLMGLCSEQSQYNLTNRTVELEVIPACRYYGLGLIPYSPLAGGLLGGQPGPGQGIRRAGSGYEDSRKRKQEALDAYEALCAQLGQEPAKVALAWLLHNPVVAAPIVGPSSIAQLESAAAATDVKLDADTLGKLDKIWPGPGGEAPQAYAW